ncbi:MAG: addiction module toxin, HicA family [Boseongicola sp. SB0673_bin_14]|nr:addiction module toxin, HicA family [Boseongicola sp. SB0667_bin_21]MYI69572.1 addiction module toxin, HicA family [Boseongicola sp. SB0673_bin_14]
MTRSESSNERAQKIRITGCRRQCRQPETDRTGTVTMASKASEDLPPGTWANILKQAGLKK